MTAVRADGSKFPAELAFTTIRLEGPVFTAFLRDITERKRAEQLLAAQYTCTRIIADTQVMDDTIPHILRAVCANLGWRLGQMWQLDPKAGLLRCVAVWHEPVAAVVDFAALSRKTTFRPGEGLPGRVWASRGPNWVSDVARDANFPRAEAATRCGLNGAFAFPILHGEEVLGVMEFLHDNILEPDGSLLAMFAAVGSQVGQFIERMQADESLRRAKEAAETANRAKSEFFSRMNHELRTPLTVILGFSQLLEMDDLSASQRESAEQIVKGGQHLLALINEVLDIARIEAGGAGMVSPEEVDVCLLVAEVLGMTQPLADQARLRLLPPPPGTCDRAVRADLQRLKQVLLNLLSNAIKYNRPGGTVIVSCAEAAGAMLRISVTDTGPGIAPEKMHRLFVPFDRLGAERKEVEGTGLGLTLSKGLVEAMQGTMGVESSPGRGSTFWVELPRIDKSGGPAGGNPATVAGPEETSVMAGTVLYVEDNPANFRLVERILKLRPGMRLISAMQGRLGIDLAREHHPDVIFLDLHLPDLPGDEVLRRLRDDAATRDIPVIVLSADATPHQIERLLAAGARQYLVKPVDVKEFLQVLGKTLNEREH
jgi:signal transduction histidine kinase/ActR/RegA family two-component response regulator